MSNSTSTTVGTAWFESSPTQDCILNRDHIIQFCQENFKDCGAKRIAGTDAATTIDPHGTYLYIGSVTRDQLDIVLELAKATCFGKRMAYAFTLINNIRVENPWGSTVALRYDIPKHNCVLRACKDMFDAVVDAGIMKEDNPNSPYNRGFNGHITLADHPTAESAAAHVASLKERKLDEVLLGQTSTSSAKLLEFGPVRLVVRDAQTRDLHYFDLE